MGLWSVFSGFSKRFHGRSSRWFEALTSKQVAKWDALSPVVHPPLFPLVGMQKVNQITSPVVNLVSEDHEESKKTMEVLDSWKSWCMEGTRRWALTKTNCIVH